jgi:hypothetical protein
MTKNRENSLMLIHFFIFFGFLKSNFVVLTNGFDKREAIALIAVEILLCFSLKTEKIVTDSRK